MKFSTALVLSGAALASAAVVPKDAYKDTCPVVKKTVKLTWVELKVFEQSKAHTWSWEDTKQKMGNSKFDPAQVYKNATSSKGSSGYPTGKAPYSSSIATTKATTSKPYGSTSTGAGNPYYGGSRTTSSGAPFPTGSKNGTMSTSSSGFSIKAGSTTSSVGSSTSTSTSTSTSSASPSASLQVWPCTAPATRYEWRNLDDGARQGYMDALRCLMNRPSGDSGSFPGSRSRYEDFASLHQQMTPSIHQNGLFLVWHRYYLHVFESVLRDECGYSGPLIWWDEPMDAGNFANAPMMTDQWMGYLPAAQNGQGVCITNTGFGTYEPNIGPDRAINNPHCLSRAVNEDWTANVNQGWVDSCRGAGNYDDYRSCMEFGPHAYGHNGVGAVMADVAPSPSDPLFFFHHGFVDRCYKQWQNDEWWNRVYEVGGSDGNGGTVTPNNMLSSMGIRPDASVNDVLDTEGAYLCYVYDKQ